MLNRYHAASAPKRPQGGTLAASSFLVTSCTDSIVPAFFQCQRNSSTGSPDRLVTTARYFMLLPLPNSSPCRARKRSARYRNGLASLDQLPGVNSTSAHQ